MLNILEQFKYYCILYILFLENQEFQDMDCMK